MHRRWANGYSLLDWWRQRKYLGCNWGTASGTGGNASVPGTGDIAVFDSNSGVSNSVIGASITVQGLECDGSTLGTGAYGGTLTHNTGVTLTLNTGAANTLRFSAGMTYTPASTSSIIALTHTSGTANIKSYGKALFALTINGAGGTTQTLDALLVNAGLNAILTLTTGIIDFNGGAGGPFAATVILVSGSNSNTRSLILGGTMTIGGNAGNNQTIWNFNGVSGLTFTKNSANIVVLTPSGTIAGWAMFPGGLTYNGITFNATTSNAVITINGNNTFSNFTINSGWNIILLTSTTTTISNAFTWVGTQTNPIFFGTMGTNQCTLSVPTGACTLTWGGLGQVVASGGATFTATNTLNFGDNTGWSITPPSDSTTTLAANTVTNLNATMGAVARGTVTTGASGTSVPTSAFTINGSAATGVVLNEFLGRVILFDGNTTTAGLRGAAVTISSSSASNTPTFTTGTLPATPASGDLFSVI